MSLILRTLSKVDINKHFYIKKLEMGFRINISSCILISYLQFCYHENSSTHYHWLAHAFLKFSIWDMKNDNIVQFIHMLAIRIFVDIIYYMATKILTQVYQAYCR
jgi:hypothetical protein